MRIKKIVLRFRTIIETRIQKLFIYRRNNNKLVISCSKNSILKNNRSKKKNDRKKEMELIERIPFFDPISTVPCENICSNYDAQQLIGGREGEGARGE